MKMSISYARCRIMFIFSCFVYMTGCATNQPKPPFVEIKIPVRISCVESVPVKPAFKSEAELKAMNDNRLANTLLFERITGQIYMGELEAVVAGCI